MTGANGVDVKLLHQLQVFNHRFSIDHMPVNRMMLVQVDTFQQYIFSVNQQYPVFDFHTPEADAV
ncbi:hypothetical protein SDC9_67061 [bioreactor metagenome]|uniref:Uncharacterized protein n=1 Tax=bioreactor metagenome TaxID=1076179 RepID=A0A644XWK3_9ZZZZ